MARGEQATFDAAPEPRAGGSSAANPGRVRIEGKYFAHLGRRLRVQGVTYGPFAPNQDAEPYPGPGAVRDDFARMKEAGINSIRTYHIPPEWLLHLAGEYGLFILVDIPWPKHLCFLQSQWAQAEARAYVGQAASGYCPLAWPAAR
jgi:glycosyl hydrolase family 2